MNMIKVLQCTFQQCFGTFTMLLFEGSTKMGLFRHLSDYAFRVTDSEVIKDFGNTKSMRIIFFPKYSKFNIDFKNAARNWEKVFCFWDNYILFRIDKLSLLRTGYFSTATNVFRSSPKISHVNKRDFCQLNWLCSDHWIW